MTTLKDDENNNIQFEKHLLKLLIIGMVEKKDLLAEQIDLIKTKYFVTIIEEYCRQKDYTFISNIDDKLFIKIPKLHLPIKEDLLLTIKWKNDEYIVTFMQDNYTLSCFGIDLNSCIEKIFYQIDYDIFLCQNKKFKDDLIKNKNWHLFSYNHNETISSILDSSHITDYVEELSENKFKSFIIDYGYSDKQKKKNNKKSLRKAKICFFLTIFLLIYSFVLYILVI